MNKASWSKHFEKRFWSKVKIPQDYLNECWIWQSCTCGNYGRIWRNNKTAKNDAHQLAYEYYYGEYEEYSKSGLCVCHKCDEPLCCNPYHLFLGTHDDNMLDKKLKGRSHNNNTYSDNIILEILSKIECGIITGHNDIVNNYQISPRQIMNVLNNVNRQDLGELFDLETLKLNYRSQLFEDEVREIKQKIKNGERLQSIADEFLVSYSCINRIRRGVNWGHITI